MEHNFDYTFKYILSFSIIIVFTWRRAKLGTKRSLFVLI